MLRRARNCQILIFQLLNHTLYIVGIWTFTWAKLLTFFWLFSKFENWPYGGNLEFLNLPPAHFQLFTSCTRINASTTPSHVKSSSIAIKQQTLFIQKDIRSLPGPSLPYGFIQCWHQELDRYQSSRPPAYLPTLGHFACLLNVTWCL